MGRQGQEAAGEEPQEKGEPQLDQLLAFAQRLRLLVLNPDSLPGDRRHTRSGLLGYLRQYMGEAPLPEASLKRRAWALLRTGSSRLLPGAAAHSAAPGAC